MKKLLVSLLLGLSLVGCGKEEVKEVKYEKKPGVEYTVENLEKFLDYELIEILAELGPCENEERKETYRQMMEYIDIALHENEGKISEPLLEYAIEYKQACYDLMNAKDSIEIRGILTELEYRKMDYDFCK